MSCRVEELGAVGRERELRTGTEHLLDAGGRFAFPIGPNHQVVAGFIAGGAAADVTVVEGVAVAEHHRVVARFSTAGTDSTIGSARRSIHTME